MIESRHDYEDQISVLRMESKVLLSQVQTCRCNSVSDDHLALSRKRPWTSLQDDHRRCIAGISPPDINLRFRHPLVDKPPSCRSRSIITGEVEILLQLALPERLVRRYEIEKLVGRGEARDVRDG